MPNRQGACPGGRAGARPAPGRQPRPRPAPVPARLPPPRRVLWLSQSSRHAVASLPENVPRPQSAPHSAASSPWPALRTGSPSACLSLPRSRPLRAPGRAMEADGAGEQMRPLLTRVRSGEAEARRQRRRRGGAAGGLCWRLRAAVAFVWRGSRGTAGLEALGDASPEDARVRRRSAQLTDARRWPPCSPAAWTLPSFSPGCSSCGRRLQPCGRSPDRLSGPALCAVLGRRPRKRTVRGMSSPGFYRKRRSRERPQ